MSFNFISFCNEYGIEYVSEGHKHCREGWIQTICPFCAGNPGYHLGFSEESSAFSCWRCGKHTRKETIMALAKCDQKKASYILGKFQLRPRDAFDKNKTKIIRPGKLHLPVGTNELQTIHKQYLINRNFDPEVLHNTWGIMGTGPIGQYKFRIIAPIFYAGRLVSYQGRDITEKSNLKYKACPEKLELIHHKDILYGLDEVKGDSIIVVEGIFDAWRMGRGAVATYGIGFTNKQVVILNQFKNRFIMYDRREINPQAGEQAEKLERLLICDGTKHTEIIELDEADDPGSLTQEQADQIKRELLG